MQKKFQKILYFLLLLVFVGCQTDPNPCSLSQEVLMDIYKLDSITSIPEIRDRNRDWMKNNYDEPSILDADSETYRFILSSSFGRTEISRIEKINGQFNVTKKVFANHQDTIGIIDEFQISKDVWRNITDSLTINNFWTYPSSIDRRGLDGASWSLEGYKPIKDKCTLKNFHSVGRWTPIDSTFISMCNLLSNLKAK